ncbi:MAG: hypothetical protein H0U76_19830 [Ktedonobacteraceae bacterium]|nr:hypothetical protein [Ktedonobacteraceae bacterium]
MQARLYTIQGLLEKQLVDLHTFVRKLPVLDPSETWTLDSSADCWATEPVQTLKTKKVPPALCTIPD